MKKVVYKGKELEVRGGEWNDVMNSCFYTVVDRVTGFQICHESGAPENELFALENPYALDGNRWLVWSGNGQYCVKEEKDGTVNAVFEGTFDQCVEFAERG